MADDQLTLSERIGDFVESRFHGVRSVADRHWRARDDARGDIAYNLSGHVFTDQLDAQSYWFRHRNAVFLDAAARYGVEEVLVDVGGGVGTVTQAFVAAGRPALVVEPLAEGAQAALRRGLHVLEASLQQTEPGDGALGFVGMFDVLEHLEDDRGALALINGALRPGGLFFITVPAHRWLWSNQDLRAGHFRRYTRRSLRGALRSAGFEVAEMTHLFAFLTPAVFALRALPSAFGRRKLSDARDAPSQSAYKPPGAVTGVLNKLCAWEAGRVARGKSIPFGTSLFAVARKPAT